MERFSWKKGMCHLVFGNEDSYFLKSLICLNLHQYLYYELKKENYQAIYFIGGEEGRYAITFGDEDSGKLYSKYRKQGMGNLFRMRGEYETCKTIKDLGIFLGEMLNMMKHEKNLAFVFEIETFAGISDYPDFERELMGEAEKNFSRKHILLVQAPTSADGSRRYLADPNGIFQTSLFPEIRLLFEHTWRMPTYETMREEMGARVSFLNDLGREEIGSMVRHFLIQKETYFEYAPMADRYADVIWAWHHSRIFRNMAKQLFPKNEERSMEVIYRSLEEGGSFFHLDRLTRCLCTQMGEEGELRQWILNRYPEDAWQGQIHEENILLRRLERLHDGRIGEDKKRLFTKQKERVLDRIEEEMRKPALVVPEEEDREYISQCIAAMQDGCAQGDIQLLEKGLEGLEYGVLGKEEYKKEENRQDISKIEALYLTMFQVAKKQRELELLYQSDGEKIEMYAAQWRHLMQEIRGYQHGHPEWEKEQARMEERAVSSGELHLLSVKKTEAVRLNKRIHYLKHLRAERKEAIGKCQEQIHNMELAATLTVGTIRELAANSEYVGHWVSDAVWENTQMLRQMEEKERENQDRMEEMFAQYADHTAETELEYEEMLREQLMYLE